ncbi:NAD-dependent epimerase/dehydratase family protein [Yoonia algicola]|uniref:NAD-dependent epimerase/dehydratase family protein n=1 Tax=Yoonia algicola TaxID=3137368 RepID=A0AAN0M4N8_9RHOB
MTFWRNKTVLVAGGAGFIGCHLVQELLRAGGKVHVVDNFSTGRAGPLKALGQDNLTVEQLDISRPAILPQADIVFNLASPASPIHYQSDPIQTWKTNILGTLQLFEHAHACNATLVQASTSEVYGDPLSHPQKETDWGHVNPVGPRACYDESKRAAETLLMDAARTSDADVRIARIFNTYGPGMTTSDGRAIPKFVAQAKAGDALTVHGDGTQTRSFCYVSDTVDGLLHLGSLPVAKGEIFNIGNPVENTILDIARHVIAIFGDGNDIVFEDRPVDDLQRRRPDIKKAETLLQWTPKVTLKEGLMTLSESQRQGKTKATRTHTSNAK